MPLTQCAIASARKGTHMVNENAYYDSDLETGIDTEATAVAEECLLHAVGILCENALDSLAISDVQSATLSLRAIQVTTDILKRL